MKWNQRVERIECGRCFSPTCSMLSVWQIIFEVYSLLLVKENTFFRGEWIILFFLIIVSGPHIIFVPRLFCLLHRKRVLWSLVFYEGTEVRSTYSHLAECFVLLFSLHASTAIKSVSVTVPIGNRWHTQMTVIPGGFIYKGTICKAEPQRVVQYNWV